MEKKVVAQIERLVAHITELLDVLKASLSMVATKDDLFDLQTSLRTQDVVPLRAETESIRHQLINVAKQLEDLSAASTVAPSSSCDEVHDPSGKKSTSRTPPLV